MRAVPLALGVGFLLTPAFGSSTVTGRSLATVVVDGDSAKAAQLAVDGLLRPETEVESRRQLETLPATDVVPALVSALRSGRLASNASAESHGYGLLIQRCAQSSGRHGFGDEAGSETLAVLERGTTHASSFVRRSCTQALGGASPADRARVEAVLRAVLGSQDYLAATQAAHSLGRIGPEAVGALDALLARMGDPTPAVRESFTTFAAAEVAAGRSEPKDVELGLRDACALARVRIGGFAIDFDRYPKLDATGRAASASALCAVILSRIESLDPSQRSVSAAKVPATARECELALGRLGAVLEETTATLRADVVRVAGMAAFDTEESVRAASDRALAAAERSPVAATQELARTLRAESAKRRK